jgi:hypothetical protein
MDDADRQAVAAAEQGRVFGPGLTFGELAIGELFDWPSPISVGREPIVKASETRYEWSRGYGTAEPFYRVERWPRE